MTTVSDLKPDPDNKESRLKTGALRFQQQAELITAWACFQQRTFWQRLKWIVTGR